MPSVLNYCTNLSESEVLENEFRDTAAMVSDDDWTVESSLKLDEYKEKYMKHTQIDVSCFDVTSEGSVETLENIRKSDKSAMLVLVSDVTVSPLKYMKPTLMASSLIMKPFNRTAVSSAFKEILGVVYADKKSDEDDKKFCVETKSGQRYIPYGKIIYFEAREKKIFLNTQFEEISFYSSLDVLEETLPPNFVRCHRGFIVNKDKITQILFAQNTICCVDDIFVPLSRSYKPALKELKEG